MQFIDIGFGNFVTADKIVAIVSSESAPAKRLVQDAKDTRTVIDVTSGRKTKSVIIMDSGHTILSAIRPKTIAGKLEKDTTIQITE